MRRLVVIILIVLFGAHALRAQDSFITARSASRLTFLAYGLGEDRLGGAKSGYIDTNVLLRIIDSTKNQYLVKLSKQHNAYVSKSEVAKDTTSVRPFYLTNSWSVKGDDVYDYVNINLDERLPYKSWMEINPSKIILDIYGVQSNTNWINQLKSVEEIKDVYFNQLEDDLVRVTIELKHKQQWGYTIGYRSKTLVIRIRRQPQSLKIRKLLIAIDAGHGGTNTGATGITSKGVEKNYTIRFANELQHLLEKKGVEVIMTRTSDTTIDNRDRVIMLQEAMPHILISLHLNSSANTSVHGVSTYYKHSAFRSLSTAILDRMLDLKLNEFGNVGNFNFTLNAPTDFPNALVEIAFLSNADDEKRILDPRFHKGVARKVYLGIKDWLKHVKKQGHT